MPVGVADGPHASHGTAFADLNNLRLRRNPIPHVEAVADDPHAGCQLASQFGTKLNIQRLKHPDCQYSGATEVGLQDVSLDEAHKVLHTRRAGILPGLGDALRVDVDANASGASRSGSLDDDAAVTTAQVIDHIFWTYL